MTDTTLTTAQITRLAQHLTDQPLGRAASAEKATQRFERLLDERIGADLAARDRTRILGAEGFELAEGRLVAAIDEADALAARETDDEPAEATTDDLDAPDITDAQMDAWAAHQATDKPSTETPLADRAREQLGAPTAALATEDARRLADDLRSGKLRHTEGRLMQLAEAGITPPPPDFSAATHARFRKKLAEVEAMVAAGDIDGLEATEINPASSSPRALDRYRRAAIAALREQAEG